MVVCTGVNGISLGVHKVRNPGEQKGYLEQRFAAWNVRSPPGLQPQLRELPPVHEEEALRLHSAADVTQDGVTRFRACAKATLNHYFPPIGDETVEKDVLAVTSRPYHSYPAGTAVVIRHTSKAVLFYVDPSVHVNVDGTFVTSIRASTTPLHRLALAAGSPVDDAKIVMKIYGAFASLLPGPAGAVAKFGVELINGILGLAGSSGPSWSEITALMRQVMREELVTNDLENVQAHYETVKRWIEVQYLPNRDKPRDVRWNMLAPQINLISEDIHLLLQTHHRIPGFGLLLLGVGIYLGLVQEQISLGYGADIRKAGDDLATDMLKVWDEVQKDRRAQISVTKYQYGVYAGGDVITCYFWQWFDQTTSERKGDRSGPWQAGGKDDHSEAGCRADAEAHFTNSVLATLTATFGDPVATAKAWRGVMLPGQAVTR